MKTGGMDVIRQLIICLFVFTLSFAYRNVIGIDQLAIHDIYLFCQVLLSGCLLCVVFNRPGVSRAVLQTAL